jgi:hypothetical protein
MQKAGYLLLDIIVVNQYVVFRFLVCESGTLLATPSLCSNLRATGRVSNIVAETRMTTISHPAVWYQDAWGESQYANGEVGCIHVLLLAHKLYREFRNKTIVRRQLFHCDTYCCLPQSPCWVS